MEQIRVPATLDSLAALRTRVEEAAAAAGLDRTASYRLVLAVDEIATNIVTHGYEAHGIAGTIGLAVQRGDGWLRVTLEDTAPPFDPRAAAQPDAATLSLPLEQRPVGGLGVMLSLSGVDDLDYQQVAGGNRTVLGVRL